MRIVYSMNTATRKAVNALHRAGYHDIAEDLSDGDVTIAGAIKAVRRQGGDAEDATALVAKLEEIKAQPDDDDTPPPADDPPKDDPPNDPPPADDPPNDDPPPADDPPNDDPPDDPPAPQGPRPSDEHWYLKPRGKKR